LKKSKYYLFITMLVFIGLIVAVGLFVSAGLTFNVFFANGIRDLLFVPQFAILAFDDITRVKQGVNQTRIGTILNITAYHEKEKLFSLQEKSQGYKEFIQRLKDEGVNIEW